jgi:chorismate synthase
MKGSEHNDLFKMSGDKIVTETNHAGGVLGGITTGMSIRAKVFFKPTSSIRKEQKTLTLDGKQAVMAQPKTARHDPCVAIRAVAVCEAMAQLVLVDALLMQRVNKMEI